MQSSYLSLSSAPFVFSFEIQGIRQGIRREYCYFPFCVSIRRKDGNHPGEPLLFSSGGVPLSYLALVANGGSNQDRRLCLAESHDHSVGSLLIQDEMP